MLFFSFSPSFSSSLAPLSFSPSDFHSSNISCETSELSLGKKINSWRFFFLFFFFSSIVITFKWTFQILYIFLLQNDLKESRKRYTNVFQRKYIITKNKAKRLRLVLGFLCGINGSPFIRCIGDTSMLPLWHKFAKSRLVFARKTSSKHRRINFVLMRGKSSGNILRFRKSFR